MRIRLSVSYHSPCSRHFSTSTTSCVSALKNPAVICPLRFRKRCAFVARAVFRKADRVRHGRKPKRRKLSSDKRGFYFQLVSVRRVQKVAAAAFIEIFATRFNPFPAFSRISFTSQITAFPLFLFTSHKTSSSGRVFATTYFSRREKQRRLGRRQVFRF